MLAGLALPTACRNSFHGGASGYAKTMQADSRLDDSELKTENPEFLQLSASGGLLRNSRFLEKLAIRLWGMQFFGTEN
jgi:hypothetical protein